MANKNNANVDSDLAAIRNRLQAITDRQHRRILRTPQGVLPIHKKSTRSANVSGDITLTEIHKKLQVMDSRFRDRAAIRHIIVKLNDVTNSQNELKSDILETGTLLSGFMDAMDPFSKRLKEID